MKRSYPIHRQTDIGGQNSTCGNEQLVYFPTSPNDCFCTTWQNRQTWK